MVTIEYNKNGFPVSDFDIEKFVQGIKNGINYDCVFRISNQLPILGVRLAICKNEIDFQKIQFKFEDKIASVNEYGVISCTPWEDLEFELSEELISTAMKKAKLNHAIS